MKVNNCLQKLVHILVVDIVVNYLRNGKRKKSVETLVISVNRSQFREILKQQTMSFVGCKEYGD